MKRNKFNKLFATKIVSVSVYSVKLLFIYFCLFFFFIENRMIEVFWLVDILLFSIGLITWRSCCCYSIFQSKLCSVIQYFSHDVIFHYTKMLLVFFPRVRKITNNRAKVVVQNLYDYYTFLLDILINCSKNKSTFFPVSQTPSFEQKFFTRFLSFTSL